MKKNHFLMLALLGLFAIVSIETPARAVEKTNIITVDVVTPALDIVTIERVSVYFPVENQTDSRPLETASKAIIDEELLACGQLNWIAISRDLHVRYGGKYNFGDCITIQTDNPDIDGVYVVHDLMNKRYRNAIDVLKPIGSRWSLEEKTLILS